MQGLPHFIIIGAMKAGTTSLYHYLKRHPEVAMSGVKETNFFLERNFPRGLEWYRRQFPDDGRIKGEASTNYTKYPAQRGVPGRIYRTLPGVRLIYVLRDPIARVVSHVHHNLLKGMEAEDTWQNKLEDLRSHYLQCSLYYMQLEQYLSFFPPEQILIVTTEELNNQRKATLQKIFRFIGVEDTGFYSPRYDQSKHTSSGRRKIRPAFVRKKLRHTPYYNFVASRLRFMIPSVEVNKPELSDAMISHLKAIFSPDVTKLREHTGRGFEEWKYRYD